MDLFSLISVLFVYYVRPQEWYSFLANVRPVQLTMLLGLVCLVIRGRGMRPQDILRTPHDWLILLFWLYMGLTSRTPVETLKETFQYPAYYLIAVQALTSIPRIRVFLGWWTFLIVFIAALAIASEFGFDPLGTYEITHGRMKDRLVLKLSIFRNPNALGHNVVPAIAMIYYICVWRRPVFVKGLGWSLIGIPLWCIWLTVSKGAFISACAVLVATFTFGRPRTMQIVIISLAIAFGGTALYALPRMSELKSSKQDEAIAGRIEAFSYGLKAYQKLATGLGFGKFLESIWRESQIFKASHSSYVQIGAELGPPGFFIFFAIIYCNLRTLLTARTKDPEEERIRRVLFILLLSYMVSSWMVDLGYRPTFFLFTGAIAAYHRLLIGITSERDEELAAEMSASPEPAWKRRLMPLPALEPALAAGSSPLPVAVLEPDVAPAATPQEEPAPPKIWRGWNRFGVIDAAISYGIMQVAVRIWQDILIKM